MKKVFRKIHLWLSVPFGIIITLICFSGAMLVFENEIVEMSQSHLYKVKRTEQGALPMEALLEKVTAALPDSVAIMGITVSNDAERAYQVSLSKPRRSSIFIDQYTGEIKGKAERSEFFMDMFLLHRFLLDSMKPGGDIFWGKLLVGISTLLFVVVLITGVVIWWPRTRKALKNSLKITVNKGWKRFWYDLHVAGGMYALIFLLAMALTGLTWSFPWYRTAFYSLFGVETTQGGGGHGAPTAAAAGKPERGGAPQASPQGKPEGERGQAQREKRPEGNAERGDRQRAPQGNTYAQWQKVLDQLKEQVPDYKQITLTNGNASVSFDRFGNQRASDRYTFDSESGEILSSQLYQDASQSGKLRGWIYSVHVGSWGGMLTRILAFVAALIGASLPITGYYLWIRKWINRSKKRDNK